MRTASIPILAASLLGCAAETVAPPPAAPVNWRSLDVSSAAPAVPPGPTTKERAIAEAYTAALASPTPSMLARLLDENVHFASPGRSDARGRDQVIRAHDVLFGAFDDRKTAVSRVWRTESTQAVEWTLSGVQSREWMSVPAKHKSVVIKGVTLLWTKDDGTVTDVHVYFDAAVVKAQLGVGPKELQALAPPPWPPRDRGETAPQVFEEAKSPEEAANLATVRASLDALEGNSEAAFLATMTDDIEVYSLEQARPARGKDEARAYFKTMHKAIGQLDTTVESSSSAGDFVVVEYAIAGEQLGPLGFVPRSRERVIWLDVVDVVQMREARMARIWRYSNPDALTADAR